MSSTRIISLAFLSCSLVAMISCTTGIGLQNVSERRTGMIGYGMAGGARDLNLLPRLDAKPAEEAAVDEAIKAGIEEVLSNSPYLDYVPHDQMVEQSTPADWLPYAENKSIRFARANNLDLVIQAWVTRNLWSGRIHLNLLIQTAKGKNVGLAMATAKSPAFTPPSERSGPLLDPASLPLWRQTAAQVTREALTKIGG